MKEIAIFCVNYNSYGELSNYIHSIEESVKHAQEGSLSVDLYIADNTEHDAKDIPTHYIYIRHTTVYPFHKNLGYFGAIKEMMGEAYLSTYDFVIISNVDMTLRPNTLERLCSLTIEKGTGWIAPSILSQRTGKDLNPRAAHGYTSRKLCLMIWLYRHPRLYTLYTKTLHKLRRKTTRTLNRSNIYAGHGSFIVLTKEYVKQCGLIDYPPFLYGEEIYVAEECRSHGLSVCYEPTVCIDDIGRVSTGKAPQEVFYQWNIEALSYITEKYY